MIFLGHDNAYVRRGAAAAIAESVEHWPQAAISTVGALQEYYRDKARILAPEFDQYVRPALIIYLCNADYS